MNNFATVLAASALLSTVIQWLKNASWFPWITQESERLNRYLTGFLTLLISVGIHMTWDPAQHSLLIEGLDWTTILPALWHWAVQWMTAHGWYRATNAGPIMLETLRKALEANGIQLVQKQGAPK